MNGGPGADAIDGGRGDDFISGGPGRDVMSCGAGDDRAFVDSDDVATVGHETVKVR